LRRRLPSWVSAVGLFVNEPAAHIMAIAREVGLDVIQLHGDETPVEANALSMPWWKAIRIGGEGASTEALQSMVAQSLAAFGAAEFCLLDSASAGYGGSGKAFDWSLVPAGAGRRLIVSGGLDEANVGAAIASLAPFGVDTSSGIQGAHPREKDVGRMERFMEAVRRGDEAAASKTQ
jgi:phosphoribosylanthranilate isomerase